MANTFTNLLVHIVFSTKHRQPLIALSGRPELEKYIGGITRNERSILLEVGTMPDHIHLVTKLRADGSVADLVRMVKSNSSKWFNDRAGRSVFAWQTGYGAFSVSASQLAGVLEYVRSQEEHHRRMTFQEEFVAFLKRHEIPYEEQYLWD